MLEGSCCSTKSRRRASALHLHISPESSLIKPTTRTVPSATIRCLTFRIVPRINRAIESRSVAAIERHVAGNQMSAKKSKPGPSASREAGPSVALIFASSAATCTTDRYFSDDQSIDMGHPPRQYLACSGHIYVMRSNHLHQLHGAAVLRYCRN